MAESAVLLNTQDVEAAVTTPISNNEVNDNQSTSSSSAKEGRVWLLPFIRVLRVHALIISLFTFTLLLILRFVLYHAPLVRYFGLGGAKTATTVLAAWAFAAIILTCITSIITVFSKISVVSSIIAIIIDIVLASGLITSAVLFTHEYPHSLWCGSYRVGEGQYEQPHPECWNWKHLSWILMKISFSLAVILGAIFVILVVCQIITICKAKSSTLQPAFTKTRNVLRSWSQRMPYTMKFNISLERRDSVVQTAEAPLGQGPVHL